MCACSSVLKKRREKRPSQLLHGGADGASLASAPASTHCGADGACAPMSDAQALAAMVGDTNAAPEARAAAAVELRTLALGSASVGTLLHCVWPLVILLSDERAGTDARGAAAGALQCLAVDSRAERAIVAAGALAPLAALCGDANGGGAVRARAARALQNLAGPALFAGGAYMMEVAVQAVEALARCDDAEAAEAGAFALRALRGGGGTDAPRYSLPVGWERSVEFTQRLLCSADLRDPTRAVARALYAPRPTPGVEIRVLATGPCKGCRGLFATRAFVPGERVVRYCGVAKPRRSCGTDESDYLYGLSGVAVDIDAERAGNESRYANDCRGTGRPRNAQFVEAWGDADGRPVENAAAASLSLAVWIEALRPLAVGEEILVSYGARYPLPEAAEPARGTEAATVVKSGPPQTSAANDEPSAATAHHAPPATPYGKGVKYWNDRHAEDRKSARAFDWLFEFAHLRSLLKTHVPPGASVLQLGCGNSRLALDWARAGHHGPLRNVDFSPTVIEQMRAEALGVEGKPEHSNVSYEVADVRDLGHEEFASGTFDAVVDKATFDCIACNGSDYRSDLEAMCSEAFRVLRPGGVYLLLSLDAPAGRLPWLYDEPGLDWSVAVTPFARRSELETSRNYADGGAGGADGGGAQRRSVDVLVPAGDEVLVGDDGDWQAKLRAFVDDAEHHTFLYVCRKR